MTEAAFFCDSPGRLAAVYGGGRREDLEASVSFLPVVIGAENFDAHLPELSAVRYIFSTWHMPRLTGVQVEQMKELEAIFYAAGRIDDFAVPFRQRGVRVVSAVAVNSDIVAAFAAAQILLAAKGYFAAVRKRWDSIVPEELVSRHAGTAGTVVSLLGAGRIGTRVMQRLRGYNMEWLVFDPLLSADAIAELGARKVELEEAFERGAVVSNHLADVPETRGLLGGSLFELLPPGATFINTGRGATVDERSILRVLKRRPDLTALLDVAAPEPPAPGSPLHELGNVFYTPHIAGAMGPEVLRLADHVIEEFRRYHRAAGQEHAEQTPPGIP